MLTCCLVPLTGLVAILIFNLPANAVLLVGLALFCPLSHLLLMKLARYQRLSPVYDLMEGMAEGRYRPWREQLSCGSWRGSSGPAGRCFCSSTRAQTIRPWQR